MLKLFRSTGLMFILTVFSLSVSLAEDEITISTYYPSPHGVYNKLQTDKLGIGDNDGDGNLTSADTPDETGNVWIAGKVGIGTGTTTPASALSVAGGIQLGEDTQVCSSAKAGTLRWNNGAVETCDGSDWKAVGGENPSWVFGEYKAYCNPYPVSEGCTVFPLISLQCPAGKKITKCAGAYSLNCSTDANCGYPSFEEIPEVNCGFSASVQNGVSTPVKYTSWDFKAKSECRRGVIGGGGGEHKCAKTLARAAILCE